MSIRLIVRRDDISKKGKMQCYQGLELAFHAMVDVRHIFYVRRIPTLNVRFTMPICNWQQKRSPKAPFVDSATRVAKTR
jgi:hypothetical protein